MRLARSIVGQAEAAALSRIILEDGYLGMGKEVQAFEADLAAYLGVPAGHVICASSGTAALHLAVQALTKPGESVLVPSLTFVSSYQAIGAAGAQPISCEVSAENVLLDLVDAERRVDKSTRVVMPVHYASNPGDPDAVTAFAARHGLRVLVDAAHSFGCRSGGRLIGSFGDVTCFSFDGIKNITCGEGGAIVTADAAVAEHCRDARLLGVERDTQARFSGKRSWDFDVKHQGWRYHMSNLFAAIGREQLKRLDGEFAPKRIALAQRYRTGLTNHRGIALLDTDLGPVVPHLQPIRVLAGRRDALMAAMEADGIGAGIHYKPNHLLTRYGGGTQSLPVTEQLYAELLSLPLHPGLEVADVDRVLALIHRIIPGAPS